MSPGMRASREDFDVPRRFIRLALFWFGLACPNAQMPIKACSKLSSHRIFHLINSRCLPDCLRMPQRVRCGGLSSLASPTYRPNRQRVGG
jgi:hypothetical protein